MGMTISQPGGGGVTDHGALTGLGDDDHSQYALADGSRGDFATEAQGALADAAVPQIQPVNTQTGTTYTLVAGDAGKLVTLSNASPVTLTLPQDSDATIPVGIYIDLMQLGAGQVTVAAGTGATLRTSGVTAKARAQYSRLGVQKVSTNTWSLFGDLAPL